MSTGKNRNKPCPCGSGKKFKKCCINKKERSTIYSCDMGENVTVNIESFKILPDNTIHIMADGKPIIPKSLNLSRIYDRSHKEPKVLFEIPLDIQNPSNEIYSWFKRYDYIFAIDTNTDITGQNISVCFHAELKKVSCNKPKTARYESIFYGPTVFKNTSKLHPEKVALISFIEELTKRLNYKPEMKIAIITDHDLANIPKYNTREVPLIENTEIYLPKGFELVYAADKPAKESILNNLIYHLDKLGKKHLKELLSK